MTPDLPSRTDVLSREEALAILQKSRPQVKQREATLRAEGFPAYTTGVGWTGYDEDKRRQLCREALAQGYTRFKAKVGTSIEEDKER